MPGFVEYNVSSWLSYRIRGHRKLGHESSR
jgi:hypothetical protein